ncbi:hypothetical protein D3C71_1555120 [compost metagenome]
MAAHSVYGGYILRWPVDSGPQPCRSEPDRCLPHDRRLCHATGDPGQPAALCTAPSAKPLPCHHAECAARTDVRIADTRPDQGRNDSAHLLLQICGHAQQGSQRANASRRADRAGSVPVGVQLSPVAEPARSAVHPLCAAHIGQLAVLTASIWRGTPISVERQPLA